jgi:hypothetical protein
MHSPRNGVLTVTMTPEEVSAIMVANLPVGTGETGFSSLPTAL